MVWLRQPDGEPHTWDDDPSIFSTFDASRVFELIARWAGRSVREG